MFELEDSLVGGRHFQKDKASFRNEVGNSETKSESDVSIQILYWTSDAGESDST